VPICIHLLSALGIQVVKWRRY